MNAIVNIDFHGHPLTTAEIDGTPHVAMRPIVEAIGLDWHSQRHRIQRHPVLSTCGIVMTSQLPGARQARKVLFLPLSKLNGWLFGVDVNRVRPEIRDTLIAYQRECFDVLADYWLKGKAVNPRATLTPEQKCRIQELVNQRAHDTGIHYATLYRALKSHFRVGSYREIRASDFEPACEFLRANRQQPSNDTVEALLGAVKARQAERRDRCYIDPSDELSVETLVRHAVPESMLPALIQIGAERLTTEK